jgi:hypothetical protein
MMTTLLGNDYREQWKRKGFEVLQAESVKKGIDTVKAKQARFCRCRLKIGRWKWLRGCKRNSGI